VFIVKAAFRNVLKYLVYTHAHTHAHAHNHFTALLDFVRNCISELAPER